MAQGQQFPARPLLTPRQADARMRKRKAARKRAARRMQPLSPRAEQARTWSLRLLTLLFALACGPLALWSGPGQRAVPALGIGCILFLLLLRSPSWGVVLTLSYLSLLGGIRRWIIPALGYISTDPLLLVAPGLVLAYFLNMLMTKRIPHDTRLSRTILWLLAIMFLQVFNPLQGSISVGLAGVVFTIVPLLWYYYGRHIGTEAVMRRLLWATITVAVLGAAYGLCQTYFGLLPSEKAWVEMNKTTYNALFVTDKIIRVFSFFTSSQEYVQFVSIGIVAQWAAFLRGSRLALLPVPLLASAIFLSSVRGAVVLTLVACVVLWAVQGRNVAAWGPRLLLAIVVATGGLVWSLQQVQQAAPEEKNSGSRTNALVTHQVEGLLNPTDTKHRQSTATEHANMLATGIVEGFRVPIGRGLGSTTLAASKFSDDTRMGSTEWDLSDCFAALGFAGGLVYFGVICFVFSNAIQWWRATRGLPALATLGILIVHIGHWLHGGSYSATMVIWFMIGGSERSLLVLRWNQAKAEAERARSQAEAETAQAKPPANSAEAANPQPAFGVRRSPLRPAPRTGWASGHTPTFRTGRKAGP